jgi:mannose-6-phosphate isomerase-like protein (cupin superfamily)
VIVAESDREWEEWAEQQIAERGDIQWKTLISAGLTPSRALTAGVARVPANGTLRAHRHEQVEVYFILEGTGVVTIDGSPANVGPGSTVFIPGNAVHSIKSSEKTGLRLAYVLAAHAFEDVEYVFGAAPRHSDA